MLKVKKILPQVSSGSVFTLQVVFWTQDKYLELLYIHINVAVHEGKALCFGYKEAIVLLKIWNKHFPKGKVS